MSTQQSLRGFVNDSNLLSVLFVAFVSPGMLFMFTFYRDQYFEQPLAQVLFLAGLYSTFFIGLLVFIGYLKEARAFMWVLSSSNRSTDIIKDAKGLKEKGVTALSGSQKRLLTLESKKIDESRWELRDLLKDLIITRAYGVFPAAISVYYLVHGMLFFVLYMINIEFTAREFILSNVIAAVLTMLAIRSVVDYMGEEWKRRDNTD